MIVAIFWLRENQKIATFKDVYRNYLQSESRETGINLYGEKSYQEIIDDMRDDELKDLFQLINQVNVSYLIETHYNNDIESRARIGGVFKKDLDY